MKKKGQHKLKELSVKQLPKEKKLKEAPEVVRKTGRNDLRYVRRYYECIRTLSPRPP